MPGRRAWACSLPVTNIDCIEGHNSGTCRRLPWSHPASSPWILMAFGRTQLSVSSVKESYHRGRVRSLPQSRTHKISRPWTWKISCIGLGHIQCISKNHRSTAVNFWNRMRLNPRHINRPNRLSLCWKSAWWPGRRLLTKFPSVCFRLFLMPEGPFVTGWKMMNKAFLFFHYQAAKYFRNGSTQTRFPSCRHLDSDKP
jgi:hypothetical protein